MWRSPGRMWLILASVVPLSILSACGDGFIHRTDSTESPSADPADEIDVSTGELFVDPQQTYTMMIGGDWRQVPGLFVKEVEGWALAEPVDGFSTNVTVLTQDAPGVNLSDYLDMSVANTGLFEVIEKTTIIGTHGNELGLLEYRGVPPGAPADFSMRFLATVDVRDGVAVVATFTATEAEFDLYRSQAEPYMRTLQGT